MTRSVTVMITAPSDCDFVENRGWSLIESNGCIELIGADEQIDMRLIDVVGREISRSEGNVISTTGLKKGVYLLQLSGITVKKVVVKQ